MPFRNLAQRVGIGEQPQVPRVESATNVFQLKAQPLREDFSAPAPNIFQTKSQPLVATPPQPTLTIPETRTIQQPAINYEDIATRRNKGFFRDVLDSSIAAYHNTIAGFHSGRALYKHMIGSPESQVTELLERAAERKEIVERHAPSVQKVGEIEGIGDAFRFGMSTVVQQLPIFGQIMGGALVAGKTGAVAGTIAGPKGIAVGSIGGSVMGSFTVGYALYAGDIFETTTSMGAERDAAQRSALLYAIPAAGVSIVVPSAVSSIVLGAFGKKAIKSRVLEGMKAMAISIPAEGLAEAVAENFVMQGELAAIPDYVITPEERRSRTINAGVAGGIAVGAMSGTTVAFRPRAMATESQISAEIDRQINIYEDSLRYRRNLPLEQDMLSKLDEKAKAKILTNEEKQTREFLRERIKQPIDDKNMAKTMEEYDNISVEVFNRPGETNMFRLEELIKKAEKTYEENLEMSAIVINKPELSLTVFNRVDDSKIIPERIHPEIMQTKASDLAKPVVEKGRLRQLDTEIKQVEKDIDRLNNIRKDLEKRGKPTKKVIEDIKKLQEKRNIIDSQRAELVLPEGTKAIKGTLVLKEKEVTRLTSKAIRDSAMDTRNTIAQRLKSINDIIRQSALTAKDKAKFVFTQAQLAEIKSEDVFQRKIGNIVDRIQRLESAERFRSQKRRLDNAVKSTKIKGRISKFPAALQNTAQVLFDNLRAYSKLNQTDAYAKLQDNNRKLDGKIPTFEQALENTFLAIKAGLDVVTEADATQLANELESLIEHGKMLKDIESFKKWQELQNDIESVEGALDFKEGIATFGAEREGLLSRTKNRLKILGIKMLTDWQGLMENIDWNRPVDQKVLRERFKTTPNNVKYAELYGNYDRQLNQSIRDNYSERFNKKLKLLPDRIKKFVEEGHLTEGFISRQVIVDIINEKVNLGKLTNLDGVTKELSMTRGELIKRWIELQDPTLTESFIHGNRYTEQIIQAIDKAMTNEDKAYANRAMEMWQELYDQVNPVYKKIYGINLAKNPFYSPIRRVGFDVNIENQLGEFLGEQNYRSAVTSGSFNQRVNSILPIETQDVFQSMDKHFGEMTYFIAWAEQVRRFHEIFNNQNVKDGILSTFGKSAGQNVLNRTNFQIKQFANKGHRNAIGMEKTFGEVRRLFIMGKMFWKPAIAVKQLVSRVNYLEVLSPMELATGEFEFWRNPIEKNRFLREESAFMRERGKFYERDINDVLKSDEYARFSHAKSFLNLGALYVRIGDADATIYPATWAYRKKLMLEQGLDPNTKAPQNIIDMYEDFADNTQQSANISTQSEFQQSGHLAQMFTTFRTQQHQNARKVVNAVKSVFQKGGTSKSNLKRVAKTIVIYHSIQNMLFQLVATGAIQLLGDEDDKGEFLKDMARAAVLGSLNFFPLGYELIDSIVRAAMGSQVFTQGTQSTPIDTIAKDIYNLTRTIDSTEIDDIDVLRFMNDFARIGGDFGLPTEQALNMGRGVHSTIQGNFLRGSLEMAQWSQWALRPLDKKEDKKKKPVGVPDIRIPEIKVPEIRVPEIKVPEITTPQRQSKAPDKENKLLSSIMNLLKV